MYTYQAVLYVSHTSIKYFLKRKRIVSLRASTRIIKYAEGEIRKITFSKIFLDITPTNWLAVVLRAYLLQMISGLPCLIRWDDTSLSPASYLRQFTVITDKIFLQPSCSDEINILDIQSAIGITTRSPWQILWLPTHTIVSLLSLLHPPLHMSNTLQFSSVIQSCLTLCDPMNRSMPGLPVHPHLPEITQTHFIRVGEAIQPSHPLSSPFPPAPNPSQHQSLFQ